MMKIADFYAHIQVGVLQETTVAHVFIMFEPTVRHPHYIQFSGEVFWVFWQTFKKSLVAWLFVFVLKK